MHLIYDIPILFLGLLVVGLCVAFGLAGVWLVRHNSWMLVERDNGTATLAHAFIGVLYAVALGLMVVGVQGTYSDVEMTVMKEANLSGDLYFDLTGLDEPARTAFQALAKRYIETVILDEWPAVASGGDADIAENIIEDLARRIITYRPNGDYESIVFAEVLDGINELIDQRRERLHFGTSGVGGITWSIVIIGAVITLSVACFYNTPGERAHYMLVATMSAMFGLMIFLIISMDHPLWGQFSVQPDAFSEVLEKIETWDRLSGPEA